MAEETTQQAPSETKPATETEGKATATLDLPERTSLLKATETDTPEAEVKEDEAKEGEKAAAKGTDRPPPDYAALKVPEGVTLDEARFSEFKDLAGKDRLSPERAQAYLDMHTATMKAAVQEPYLLFEKVVQGWEKEIKADSEVGGAKFEKSAQQIARMFDTLVPREQRAAFNEMLGMTGAGSNPLMFKMLHKAAEKLTEGGYVGGRPPGQKPRTLAEALYGGSEEQ